MEDGNLGDIVVWGNDSDKYPTEVKNGLLYDWNEDNILKDYGPYIKKHMQILQELKKNLVGLLLEALMKCVEIHGTLLKQE